MALPARLMTWRLETSKHFSTWQTAEGAFLFGGRWSSPNRRVLYTSLDPSTAILEVAVHKGLRTLDAVAHTLIQIELVPIKRIFKLDPASVPNAHWLRPGTISKDQQLFGDALLKTHALVLIPSVVSTHSWNLLIDVDAAKAQFILKSSEAFALNPSLTRF